MLGGDGKGLPNRQVVLPPALRGRSVQDLSMVLPPQERTGVTYLNMPDQSGVPFAVRLHLVQLLKFRDLKERDRSGVPFAVRLLPVPLRRMNLQLKVAPLPALSPRRPFGVPLGLDVEGRVPVSARRRSKVAKASPV